MELMIGLAVAASFVAMSFAVAAVLKHAQENKKQREMETFNAIVGAAQLKLIEAIKFGGMTSKEAKSTPKDKSADLNDLLRQATRSVTPSRTSASRPQPKVTATASLNPNGPYGKTSRSDINEERMRRDESDNIRFGMGYHVIMDDTPSRSSGGSNRCDDNSSSRDYDSGPSGGGCDSGGGGGGE